MEKLFARSEHGGYKVVPNFISESRVKGLEVWWPEGPRAYKTNRQAFIALVNKSPEPLAGMRDPRTTFDRYFRRGKYLRETLPEVDVLEVFAPKPELVTSAPPKRTLGIDLGKRGHEVRKLFYAGFALKISYRGFDPEDVLQELYQALLIRNAGKCPWDPQKSSFGHYVHMVAGCIISNYIRKHGRIEANEVFGTADSDGEAVDVAASDLPRIKANQDESLGIKKTREELRGLVAKEASVRGIPTRLAEEIFELMSEGVGTRELRKELPYPPQKVSDAAKLVQEVALLWRDRQ